MSNEVRIHLIRHGATAGNREKRYIGTTDEPLSAEGLAGLKEKNYPRAQAWFVSPMKRCLETAAAAQCLYPGSKEREALVPGNLEALVAEFWKEPNRFRIANFRECDFGRFENKNYLELSGDPDYQAWIDSNGTLPFPGGEKTWDFKERCCLAFEAMVEQIRGEDWSSVNVVIHGGTVMSIMERYALPERSYYEWQIDNGGGYTLYLNRRFWQKGSRMKALSLNTGENEGERK